MFTQTLQIICIILNELPLNGIPSTGKACIGKHKRLLKSFLLAVGPPVAVCVNPIQGEPREPSTRKENEDFPVV